MQIVSPIKAAHTGDPAWRTLIPSSHVRRLKLLMVDFHTILIRI